MRDPLLVVVVWASALALLAGCSAPDGENPAPVAPAKDTGGEVALVTAPPPVRRAVAVEVVVRATYSESKHERPFPEKGRDARIWLWEAQFNVLEVLEGKCETKVFRVNASARDKGYSSAWKWILRITLTAQRKEVLLDKDGRWFPTIWLELDEFEEVRRVP